MQRLPFREFVRRGLVAASVSLLVWGGPSLARAQEPNLATGSPHGVKLTADCSGCHTPEGWRPVKARISFDHDRQTAFDLVGRHREASCTACHLQARFDEPRLTADECGACHVDVHLGNFSERCSNCHNTLSFNDVAGLALHARTGFPLTGSHIQVTCESCHIDDRGGAYSPLNTDCYSCHGNDYNAAASIDHVDLGFSSDCRSCHNTLGWGGSGGTFDHPAVSGGFELVGAHARIRCEGCHLVPGLAPRYAAAGQDDCIACHQDDYQREHGGAFPTDCIACHDNESWGAEEVEHVVLSNGFELLGAHSRIACESCHIVPGFASIYNAANENDCIACHQEEYQREHAGSGFPNDCLACHSVDNWNSEFRDHDQQFFPIYSGRHANRWNGCETCHTVSGDFASFTCLNGCHGRNETDNKHSDERDYVYDSVRCYACHPTGGGD